MQQLHGMHLVLGFNLNGSFQQKSPKKGKFCGVLSWIWLIFAPSKALPLDRSNLKWLGKKMFNKGDMAHWKLGFWPKTGVGRQNQSFLFCQYIFSEYKAISKTLSHMLRFTQTYGEKKIGACLFYRKYIWPPEKNVFFVRPFSKKHLSGPHNFFLIIRQGPHVIIIDRSTKSQMMKIICRVWLAHRKKLWCFKLWKTRILVMFDPPPQISVKHFDS